MKRLASLLLLASAAFAQVTITPLLPTGHVGSNYGFNVLAGSQTQISAILRGSTSMHVNWTVVSTYGGGTATLDRSTGAIPLVNVTAGSTQGTCSINGTVGAYTVTSTVGFTVRATSVDDATKTADFPFKVCGNTTKVEIQPAYRQAYKAQTVYLQSYVTGNEDESGTWAITSQPSGGDGALADTNKRDAAFSATVTGRYTLTYTSASDSSKSSSAIVYVSPNAIPVYGLSTPNLTASAECYADPAFTGTVYEVGAGFAYASPAAANVAMIAAAAGSIMRIHNTDTTGTAPSTYHNYLYFDGTNKGGTAAQPKIVCGVPDAAGNLPVLDGANATGTHGSALYGLVSLWGPQGYNTLYSAGSVGPSYFIIAGLAIRNATENYTFSDFTNGNAVTAYGTFAAGINMRSGWFNQFIGNDIQNNRNGIYTQANGAAGYQPVTRFAYYAGNHFKNNSATFVSGQHHVYNSTWYGLFEGNLFEDLIANASGNMIKDRGQEPIYRYNAFLTTNGGYMNAINTPSDAPQFSSFEAYLGAAGDTSCQAPYCGYDTSLTADQLVGNQRGMFKGFIYGNIYAGRKTDIAAVQLNDSEGDGGYDFYNQTELLDHLGRFYVYHNTFDNIGQGIFSALSIGQDDVPQPAKATLIAQNNIFYRANTGFVNVFSLTNHSSLVAIWKTNLFNAGTVNLTLPIANKAFGPRTDTVNGWVEYTNRQQFDWNGTTVDGSGNAAPTISIDQHQTGISATNFLLTSSANHKPYNSATFAPTADSDAVGVASAITDPQMSLLPVRAQYNVETHQMVPRTNLTTVGAVGSGSLPTLTGLALRADSLNYLSQSGNCYYLAGDVPPCLPSQTGTIYIPQPIFLKGTYSDGLVADVGPEATWSAPNLTAWSDNELSPNAVAPLSGTLTATYSGKSLSQPYAYDGATVPGTPPPVTGALAGAGVVTGNGAIH